MKISPPQTPQPANDDDDDEEECSLAEESLDEAQGPKVGAILIDKQHPHSHWLLLQYPSSNDKDSSTSRRYLTQGCLFFWVVR